MGHTTKNSLNRYRSLEEIDLCTSERFVVQRFVSSRFMMTFEKMNVHAPQGAISWFGDTPCALSKLEAYPLVPFSYDHYPITAATRKGKHNSN
ncbi:hypothetical protein CEXT_640451 [Caerostris extrusa]|uniref:Uncharacterized protein n=1 Tax=Caerostris extrusa TaxID=172846 RepID=A0AAV4WS73_CAEEX|nr:hypothetical protein CEXT_640451 [Caerostris extrusa]